MKTPTPQEQAEMLIEAHLPNTEQFDYRNGYQPDKDAATKAAIVTVETVLSAKPIGNSLEYWQEVLTILKGKL